MNGREAAGAAVLAIVCFAAGVIDHQADHHQPAPRPTPTPKATQVANWRQLYADAQTAVDANGISLRAATVTGQNTTQLHTQWCAAAKASNTADKHLGATRQISTKDCK